MPRFSTDRSFGTQLTKLFRARAKHENARDGSKRLSEIQSENETKWANQERRYTWLVMALMFVLG
jgi:hypothetical protein